MALLDGLAATIYGAAGNIGGTTWDMTLKKKGAATKDAYGGFTQTTTDYTGRGFLEEYSDLARVAGGVPHTDRKAVLFASSFTVEPEAGDLLTAESTDFEIVSVSRDPAAATWTLQVR